MSLLNHLSFEEQAAASAISMISKRGLDDNDNADAAGGMMRPAKMARSVEYVAPIMMAAAAPVVAAPAAVAPSAPPASVAGELQPAPYFYYRDHSMDVDEDPLTPLTPPGRVPNFPAKMHAILSRPDFRDVVAWLPHGRSWRVLKPREFEIKIIPLFFEHAKFSSFVRQANGWGFRRITQGKDRNSYYHELFLRGLPHLCKTMKRPGVKQKKTADPEHEPDLYEISQENPVPEKADHEDSILLNCTVQNGPRARVPIYTGPATASSMAFMPQQGMAAPMVPSIAFNPTAASNPSPAASVATDNSVNMKMSPLSTTGSTQKQVVTMPTMPSFLTIPTPGLASAAQQPQAPVPPTAANFAAFNHMAMQAMPVAMNMNATAASQFAAGFAAATAFSQHHFSTVFNMAQQQQQAQQQQPPAQQQQQQSS